MAAIDCTYSSVLKANPYHDHHTGEFTHSESGSSDPKNVVGRLLEAAKEKYSSVHVTQEAGQTRFVLPDGTRLSTSHRGAEHSDVLFEAIHASLDDAFRAGIVRYNAGEFGGVQFANQLTEAQAQVIADDWNYTYKAPLTVDAVPLKEGKPDYEGSSYGHLALPFTADRLRHWSRLDSAFHSSKGTYASVLKANPYHDHSTGQFTTADGGSGRASGGYLSSPGEALKSLAKGHAVNIAPEDVRTLLEQAAKRTDNPNLAKVHVNGTPIFDKFDLGIPRSQMPQIPKELRPRFLDSLKKQGIAVHDETVHPFVLHPSQDEINARAVGERLLDPRGLAFGRVLVSKDNYILDGHHHWAVVAALAIEQPKLTVPITRLGIGHAQALKMMHAFDKENGIKSVPLKAARELTTARWLVAKSDAIEFTDRYQALGIPYPNPKTMCKGQCEGTGYVPVYHARGDERAKEQDRVSPSSETDPRFLVAWEAAEKIEPSKDGWHFIQCPDCKGTGLSKVAIDCSLALKFNPSHDAKTGEFASGDTGQSLPRHYFPRTPDGRRIARSSSDEDYARIQTHASNAVLYHGTSDDAIAAIKKEGLVPHGSAGGDEWAASHWGIRLDAGRPPSVFLAKSDDYALNYAYLAKDLRGGTPVILKVEVPITEPVAVDEQDHNALRLAKTIPPAWIKQYAVIKDEEEAPEWHTFKREGVQTIYAVVICDQATLQDATRALKFNTNHDAKTGEFSTVDEKQARWTGDFDLKKINSNGQRFMVHPSSSKVFVGDYHGSPEDHVRGRLGVGGKNAPVSHAEEFADAQGKLGLPGKYDDYIKGWIFNLDGGSEPTIDFYSKYFSDNAEGYDAYAHTAEAFVKSGHATADTRVRGLDGAIGYQMSGKRTLGEAFPFLFKRHAKAASEWTYILKANPYHDPHNGEFTFGSMGGGSASTEVVAGDREKFTALKTQWAHVNNELLDYVDTPNAPEAASKVDQLKGIVKSMYTLKADPGGLTGIGLPGGPRDMVVVGAGPGGLAASVMGGTVLTGAVQSGNFLSGGVNTSMMVKLDNGARAVYKPETGEQWTGDFVNEDISRYLTNRTLPLAERETMAYEVDQHLGLGIVPETVLRPTLKTDAISGRASSDDEEDEDYDPQPGRETLNQKYQSYRDRAYEGAQDVVGEQMNGLYHEAQSEHAGHLKSRAEEINTLWNTVVKDYPDSPYGAASALRAHPALPLGSQPDFKRRSAVSRVDPIDVLDEAAVGVSSPMNDKEKKRVEEVLRKHLDNGAQSLKDVDTDKAHEHYTYDQFIEAHQDTENRLLESQILSFTDWKRKEGYTSNENNSAPKSRSIKNPKAPHPEGGSLQAVIPEVNDYGDYTDDSGTKFAALDYLVGSMDRHRGNIMYDRDGNAKAIDNGYSFPAAPTPDGFKFRSSPVRDWLSHVGNDPGNVHDETRIPILKSLQQTDWKAFVDRHPTMSPEERDAFLGRVEKLKTALRTPEGLPKLWQKQRLSG